MPDDVYVSVETKTFDRWEDSYITGWLIALATKETYNSWRKREGAFF
jgi:hypothetical protein